MPAGPVIQSPQDVIKRGCYMDGQGMRWNNWKFELMENSLRLYADMNELEYDSSHPLAVLPPKAPQAALKRCGMSYGEIAKIACVNYATVNGWFNPRRNPSRATVRGGIFPALCEGCLRVSGMKNETQFDERLVAKRVFALLTTGSARTPEEAALELARARERYNRSALSYAASTLTQHDLNSIAHSALGFLNLNHQPEQCKGAQALSASTFKQEGTDAVDALEKAAKDMELANWKVVLDRLSLQDLQQAQKELELTIARKSTPKPATLQ